MNLTTAIDRFLDDRTLKRRSPATIARYRAALHAWRDWRARDATASMELTAPRRPAVARRGLSPNAVRSARNIIRALMLFCVESGDLAPEWRVWLQQSRLPSPAIEIQDRAYWDASTVTALCAAAGDDEDGRRCRAAIWLIYESGMRLDELCRLHDADTDRARRRARIVGKGRKKRWVYWGAASATALDAYLAVRRGPDAGAVLRGTSAHNNGQALSADALRAQIKRLARKAGVTLPPGAPIHAGRHAFAHLMLDGGAAISEIADLMGHGDVRTTMRYLHERPEILQSIHARALHQADPAADS